MFQHVTCSSARLAPRRSTRALFGFQGWAKALGIDHIAKSDELREVVGAVARERLGS